MRLAAIGVFCESQTSSNGAVEDAIESGHLRDSTSDFHLGYLMAFM